MEGPAESDGGGAGPPSAPLVTGTGLSGVQRSVKSYLPVRPVLSTTLRSTSRDSLSIRLLMVIPVAVNSPGANLIKLLGPPPGPLPPDDESAAGESLGPFLATTSA